MYGRSDEGTENEDGEEGGEISGGGKRVDVFEMTCSGSVYALIAKEANGGIRRCESNVSIVR